MKKVLFLLILSAAGCQAPRVVVVTADVKTVTPIMAHSVVTVRVDR